MAPFSFVGKNHPRIAGPKTQGQTGRVVNPRPYERTYFDAPAVVASVLKRLWRTSSSNCAAALSAAVSSTQLQTKWPSSWA